MAKVKMGRGNPSLDMTPMVDLAFLLVTFFMLTATVRVDEAAVVDPPSSTSDKLLPKNIVLITVDDEGKVFFNINDPEVQDSTLMKMSAKYEIGFTAAERKKFLGMAAVGVPMDQLKDYINMESEEREEVSTGIPIDSTDNQLADWIRWGRYSSKVKAKTLQDEAKERGKPFKYEPLRYAIKADGNASYKKVEAVIDVFRDLQIYRFNMITNLEQGEEG